MATEEPPDLRIDELERAFRLVPEGGGVSTRNQCRGTAVDALGVVSSVVGGGRVSGDGCGGGRGAHGVGLISEVECEFRRARCDSAASSTGLTMGGLDR